MPVEKIKRYDYMLDEGMEGKEGCMNKPSHIIFLCLLNALIVTLLVIAGVKGLSKPVAPTRSIPVATLSLGSASGILWLQGDSLYPKLPYCIKDSKAQPYRISEIQRFYKNGDTIRLVVKY